MDEERKMSFVDLLEMAKKNFIQYNVEIPFQVSKNIDGELTGVDPCVIMYYSTDTNTFNMQPLSEFNKYYEAYGSKLTNKRNVSMAERLFDERKINAIRDAIFLGNTYEEKIDKIISVLTNAVKLQFTSSER